MKKIALVFDADNTLMRGYHPSAILEKRGIDVNEFWKKATSLQDKEKAKGESNVEIVYLAMLMHEIRYGKLKGLTIKELKETGKEIDKILYKGLPEFFDKLRKNNEDTMDVICSLFLEIIYLYFNNKKKKLYKIFFRNLIRKNI